MIDEDGDDGAIHDFWRFVQRHPGIWNLERLEELREALDDYEIDKAAP